MIRYSDITCSPRSLQRTDSGSRAPTDDAQYSRNQFFRYSVAAPLTSCKCYCNLYFYNLAPPDQQILWPPSIQIPNILAASAGLGWYPNFETVILARLYTMEYRISPVFYKAMLFWYFPK